MRICILIKSLHCHRKWSTFTCHVHLQKLSIDLSQGRFPVSKLSIQNKKQTKIYPIQLQLKTIKGAKKITAN